MLGTARNDRKPAELDKPSRQRSQSSRRLDSPTLDIQPKGRSALPIKFHIEATYRPGGLVSISALRNDPTNNLQAPVTPISRLASEIVGSKPSDSTAHPPNSPPNGRPACISMRIKANARLRMEAGTICMRRVCAQMVSGAVNMPNNARLTIALGTDGASSSGNAARPQAICERQTHNPRRPVPVRAPTGCRTAPGRRPILPAPGSASIRRRRRHCR